MIENFSLMLLLYDNLVSPDRYSGLHRGTHSKSCLIPVAGRSLKAGLIDMEIKSNSSFRRLSGGGIVDKNSKIFF